MPALGSSVIIKSGKKFGPKAPARRPTAANPTPPPTRNGAGPARASQIPQPGESTPAAVHPVDLTTSSAPNAAIDITAIESALPQERATSAQKRPREDEGATETAVNRESPSRDLDIGLPPSLAPEQGSLPAASVPAPGAPHDGPEALAADPGQAVELSSHARERLTLPSSAAIQVETPSSSTPPPPVATPTQDVQPEASREDAPRAKRQRLRPDRSTKPAALPSSTATASQRRPNVRIRVSPQPTDVEQTSITPPNNSGAASAEGRPIERTISIENPATKGKSRKRQAVAGAEEVAGTSTNSNRYRNAAERNSKSRKPRQKSRMSNSQRLQNAAAEIVADAVEGTTSSSRGRGGRKAREPTPEEAENEVIAPGAIKMAELCKDTRKGKKSETFKALQDRDREELARQKQKELQRLVQGVDQPDPGASGEQAALGAVDGGAGPLGEEATERQEDIVREVADTYVDEHGQIRINTESLRIDRHAQAAAARKENDVEAVVENDLSKPAVNSRTYQKREPLNSWPEQLTDEFYEAIRTFGTDFGMVSRMLRKTRRAVKLKFNREERSDPGRINQALIGARIAIDLDEYSRRAGENIKDTQEHEQKMEEDRKKIEQDAADELRAKEERDQLRREEANPEQERVTVPDDSSGKENREAGRKKKKDREKRKGRSGHRKKQGAPAQDLSGVA